MDDVFVGSLMSAPVHTIRGDASLREAARRLLDHDIGALVVADDATRLEGILTATDFVRMVAENDGYGPQTLVSTAMSTDVVTATASESVEAAADRMIETGHYHLPVLDGETVIGIVTAPDLAAYVSTAETPSPPHRT